MDPILIISASIMQIGARHLDFNLTPIQKEIVKHKYFQIFILFSILYITTRDLIKTIIILCFLYLCIYILFNEYSNYNLLSKPLDNDLKKTYNETLNFVNNF